MLRDISRGGACLAGAGPVPAGAQGLLHIDGITLPVPLRVVAWTQASGLHVQFQLEGLGLDAFLGQLDRRLDVPPPG